MTIEDLREKVKDDLNTLVLECLDFQVVQLIDVSEDEEDFYYVFKDSKQQIYHCSILGGYTKIKNVIPDEDYELMVKRWNFNKNVNAI